MVGQISILHWVIAFFVLGSVAMLVHIAVSPSTSGAKKALFVVAAIFVPVIPYLIWLMVRDTTCNGVSSVCDEIAQQPAAQHGIAGQAAAGRWQVGRVPSERAAPVPLTSGCADGTRDAVQSEAHDSVLAEEHFWALAMVELESDRRRPGLWAKSFGESGGVDSTARAAYLSTRVSEMKAETHAARTAEQAKIRESAHAQVAHEVPPEGACPNCDARIPLSSTECARCKALFSEGSAWKVRQLG